MIIGEAKTTFLAVVVVVETLTVLPSLLKLGLVDRLVATILVGWFACFDCCCKYVICSSTMRWCAGGWCLAPSALFMRGRRVRTDTTTTRKTKQRRTIMRRRTFVVPSRLIAMDQQPPSAGSPCVWFGRNSSVPYAREQSKYALVECMTSKKVFPEGSFTSKTGTRRPSVTFHSRSHRTPKLAFSGVQNQRKKLFAATAFGCSAHFSLLDRSTALSVSTID